MSQTYYTILTKIGTELIANATALGVQLKLTHMAVGDGNGSIPKPIATQTKLINEVRRAAINTVSVDKNNPNQIIAEQVIPETEGGWFIHEVGLYDDKGHLIAVGNCPSTYKPKLAEGSGRTQVIRMIIIIDNVDSIALKIDPAVVLATREYVDNLISTKISEHKKSTDHPRATTRSKGFVQLNSTTNSTSETEAATPKAVKSAYDLASNAVKKTGDEMTGQLRFSPTSYGIKFLHENKNELVMRSSGDSFIYAYYDAESDRWANKLRYVSSSNTWRFENINDVTINNKSVLKTGDAVQLLGDLANTNLNDLTGSKEGVYFQGRNAQASIENNYPINEAGTLQVLKNGADGAGCCQIYTAYRNARQFIRNYRGGTKTWEPWVESYTTANKDLSNVIDKFTSNNNESVVFSPNHNYHIVMRNDGICGVYNHLTNKFAWFIDKNGGIDGYIGCDRVVGLDEYIRYRSVPAGVPLPYPKSTPPTGWLECNGSRFDKNRFQLLANAYPSGFLPDLRGEFIRGWDNGKNVDQGRGILSWQGDAIRNIWGELDTFVTGAINSSNSSGVFSTTVNSWPAYQPASASGGTHQKLTLNAATQVPTAYENRPRNLAFMYIVEAK
jgi:phage-related tail fiber protein